MQLLHIAQVGTNLSQSPLRRLCIRLHGMSPKNLPTTAFPCMNVKSPEGTSLGPCFNNTWHNIYVHATTNLAGQSLEYDGTNTERALMHGIPKAEHEGAYSLRPGVTIPKGTWQA